MSDGCLNRLPDLLATACAANAIGLIDVLWIDTIGAVAFEIEDTISNYSRIVRMLNLALGIDRVAERDFFRVAPDSCK